MKSNVRIDRDDLEPVEYDVALLGVWCPLCKRSMDEHTVITELVPGWGAGKPKRYRSTGWACPVDPPGVVGQTDGQVDVEQELVWITHQLESTGRWHDILAERLEVLAGIIARRGSAGSVPEPDQPDEQSPEQSPEQ